MKRVLLVLMAVAFAAASYGQGFAGSWKLNASKSKLNDQFSMAPKSLKVTQNGNAFEVAKTVEFQGQSNETVEKYTLDGKECTNAGFMNSTKKSKATISADKKVVTIKSTIATDNGNIESEEIFSLKDGGLVFETKTKSSWGDMSETGFYEKK
ncbi:hypothetical protein [Xiashengella succiniciproducens]|jgi:hypothetical protein|uniref:Lipocalin-like domain-containing protein n=1 Tax=Xiashengella succiniciproducens TaxID=2949635 RepID=A0A9J6ZT11_9BACT|nr:hypothetical protein [Alkaliflexus sp. Ai-910]URW80384.1 hypothetical protein M9189_03320 [Alkaliflexus sp. Ai-910]